MAANRTAANKVNVPDELREILFEFTVNYLLEQPQPTDVISYACDFFNKLKEDRKQVDVRSPSVGDESVLSDDGNFNFLC